MKIHDSEANELELAQPFRSVTDNEEENENVTTQPVIDKSEVV
jgi:hypothetical protein